ncbi:hypothetical protein JDV02_002031 [Purpureocillium takamizusanense]|uniref:Aminoglycoside phosphotransferase domain-containing protein n=1 Tax=Purpureocillium takamizusanense TaxID=2060973 RepID=A0A9Q8Q8F8_9HYPO|nr:uncharacterized protein JDV02_002031 [Purpureocillium takamizusanense]UNI15503.1 hypothetical protein JDV02_002031 [Purpureocillium takamizusanense]
MLEITSLKSFFDEIEETNGDDECRAWLSRVFDAKVELAAFVAARRRRRRAGTATEYVGFLKGSFNFSLRFKFSDGGPDAIIRFPKPGHTATALRDEKVANEIEAMEFLRQNTTMPIPHVHCWGLTKDSPHRFGPFIIMDYVEGEKLSTLLKKPMESDDEDLVLNPSIEDATLATIYRQIASYLLQLSRLSFNRIGAISKDGSKWSVTKRPLTYNMNELATVAGYPQNRFPTSTFDRASDYFASLSREHLAHLWTQRNIADDAEIARARFVARRRFAQLIPYYCISDSGPFLPFCDDLRPSNMLVDPKTLKITAVLDLEFTNAMPAQFTYDPPWWLLLSGPEAWLDRDSMDEFRKCYEPRMEQFLHALEEEEQEEEEGERKVLSASDQESALLPPPRRLSSLMRESWRCGRFWFDYAARKSFELDTIYWTALHGSSSSGDGIEVPEDGIEAELGPFIEAKMEQLRLYEEECAARFSQTSSG